VKKAEPAIVFDWKARESDLRRRAGVRETAGRTAVLDAKEQGGAGHNDAISSLFSSLSRPASTLSSFRLLRCVGCDERDADRHRGGV
jgi:hypothetical protein